MDIYRRLVNASPQAHDLDLAKSLHNLAIALVDDGRQEDALGVVLEAIDIYQQLADLPTALIQSANRVAVDIRKELELTATHEIGPGQGARPPGDDTV